jgi:hypothetical protein
MHLQPFGAQRCRGLRGLLGQDVGDDHAATVLRHVAGELKPETAGAAGDQHTVAGKQSGA